MKGKGKEQKVSLWFWDKPNEKFKRYDILLRLKYAVILLKTNICVSFNKIVSDI